jgi:hypothetical protein
MVSRPRARRVVALVCALALTASCSSDVDSPAGRVGGAAAGPADAGVRGPPPSDAADAAAPPAPKPADCGAGSSPSNPSFVISSLTTAPKERSIHQRENGFALVTIAGTTSVAGTPTTPTCMELSLRDQTGRALDGEPRAGGSATSERRRSDRMRSPSRSRCLPDSPRATTP